jgi:hypothetical protein
MARPPVRGLDLQVLTAQLRHRTLRSWWVADSSRTEWITCLSEHQLRLELPGTYDQIKDPSRFAFVAEVPTPMGIRIRSISRLGKNLMSSVDQPGF